MNVMNFRFQPGKFSGIHAPGQLWPISCKADFAKKKVLSNLGSPIAAERNPDKYYQCSKWGGRERGGPQFF
jgi:hypothetical protein